MPPYDWNEVQRFYDEGHMLKECCAHFGFRHASWYYAQKRGWIKPTVRRNRGGQHRYDWREVQRYYDQGHTYRECIVRFGFNPKAWTAAVRRGVLRARARALPVQVMLAQCKSRGSLKRRLLEDGILANRCSECGIESWLGQRLSIQLDHINGVRNDHRLENLRMLCPNCHSQTATFGWKNAKGLGKRSLQDSARPP